MAVPKKVKKTRGEQSRRSSRSAARSRRDEEEEDNDDLFDDDGESFDRSGVASQLESRYGNAKAALNQVLGERFRESRKRRRLQARLDETLEELEDLKETLGIDGDVPEKSVLMSEDDKKELEAYRGLSRLEDVKKRFDEIKKKVEEHETLSTKAAETERKEQLGESAKLAGNWDVDVLETIVRDHNLLVELKEETVNGQKTKVPYVRENKDGSQASKLTEYVNSNDKAKKLLPSLTAKPANGSQERTGTGTGGRLYPRTSGSGAAPTTDVVANTLASRDVRPSQRNATSDK